MSRYGEPPLPIPRKIKKMPRERRRPDDVLFLVSGGHRYPLVPYGWETGPDGDSPFATPCHLCDVAPGDRHRRGCPMGGGRPHARPSRCRDCGIRIGGFHLIDCEVESCPCCGGLFAGCECRGVEERRNRDDLGGWRWPFEGAPPGVSMPPGGDDERG